MTQAKDGKQQVEAMAKLAEPWQPTELGGFCVGDLVDLPTIGRCEVIGLMPPSLLKLRASGGAELKAGYMACFRTRIKRPERGVTGSIDGGG